MTTKRAGTKHDRHISSEDIAAFLANELSLLRKERVIVHLSECPACRTLVAEVTLSQKFVPDPNESSQ